MSGPIHARLPPYLQKLTTYMPISLPDMNSIIKPHSLK